MAENSISIDVELAISQAQRDIAKLSNQFEKFGTDAQESIGKGTSAFNVFKGALLASAVSDFFKSAASAAYGFFKVLVIDGIKAAGEAEAALAQLEFALGSTGLGSRQASLGLQAFAQQLQQNSTLEDDAIIKNMALIQSLGQLDSQGLQRATQAAADLSAALGKDFDTASELMGRAAAGNTAALSKMGIKLDEGGTKAERFEQLLALVEARFGGAALAKTNTFSGALEQAKNVWGNLTEKIGEFITKNPVVVNGIKLFSDGILRLTNYIDDNRASIQKMVTNGLLFLVDGFIHVLSIGDGVIKFFRDVETVIAIAGYAAKETFLALDQFNPFTDIKNGAVSATQNVVLLGNALKIVNETPPAPTTILGMLEQEMIKAKGFLEQHQNDVIEAEKAKSAAHGKTAVEAVGWLKFYQDAKKQGDADSVNATRSSLGVIAGLQQSKIKELFYIGKAAAIAQATINGFEAVTKAFAIGGPVGFVLGPLVLAASAIQVGAIAAQQPAFAQGGIVGGTSTTGDQNIIRANSREMILTQEQQATLFGMANNGGEGGMTVVFNGDVVVDSEARVDDLIDKINKRVRGGGVPMLATRLVG